VQRSNMARKGSQSFKRTHTYAGERMVWTVGATRTQPTSWRSVEKFANSKSVNMDKLKKYIIILIFFLFIFFFLKKSSTFVRSNFW